jgi:pyruvate dehydrogenase complex dehydrogenase (E1) component
VRIAVLWLFALSFAFCVGTLLFAPAFVSVFTESRAVSSEMRANADTANAEYAETLAAIDRANTIAAKLSQNASVLTVTDVMREIDSELGTGVTFEGMSFARAADGAPQIELFGTADTREDLARLVERLKANPYFVDVAVPFGQLAQATNATFTATLSVRPPQQ